MTAENCSAESIDHVGVFDRRWLHQAEAAMHRSKSCAENVNAVELRSMLDEQTVADLQHVGEEHS
jgi:hypothetical protein